jgi:hypothetical protein
VYDVLYQLTIKDYKMIKFDPSLISVEVVLLKSVTTSLGGSISVVDQENSTDKKEVYQRIAVPLAVTRSFIQKTNKITKYFKPTVTALVKYNNSVIAMERHMLSSLGELESEGVFGTKCWVSNSETNIETMLAELTKDGQWYFDGRYVYTFMKSDLGDSVRGGEMLTSDGGFRKVVAQAIDMQVIEYPDKLLPSDRSCLAFITAAGNVVVSPPIWKNLSDIGVTQLRKAVSSDADDTDGEDESAKIVDMMPQFGFDKIDETLSVNLNFALAAGSSIGKTFGYEFVEPLRLPQLMIDLCTVNLPNIPSSIKATYGIDMKFTHAISWLLGLSTKSQNLEEYVVVRSLMKQLTKKGIFRSNVFNADRVFKADQTVSSVVLKSLSSLIADQDISQMSLTTLLMQARSGASIRAHQDDIHSIATLMNDD